jgi:hypothetical protein
LKNIESDYINDKKARQLAFEVIRGKFNKNLGMDYNVRIAEDVNPFAVDYWIERIINAGGNSSSDKYDKPDRRGGFGHDGTASPGKGQPAASK